MSMEKQLPNRKPIRLKDYDYGSPGAYFVTLCTQDRKRILSEITNMNLTSVGEKTNPNID